MTPLFMSKSNQVGYAGSKAIYKVPEKCLKVGENENESSHNSLDLEVGSKVIFTERIPPAPDVLLQFAYDIFTNFSFL